MAWDELSNLNARISGAPASRRPSEKIHVYLMQDSSFMGYTLYTNDSRVECLRFASSSILDKQDTERLPDHYIRHYQDIIVRGGFATPEEIEWHLPGRFQRQSEEEKLKEQQLRMEQMRAFKEHQERERRRKSPNPFEVNMVEALVGWKGWNLGADLLLHSPSIDRIWKPDEPLEAHCAEKCRDVPHEEHGCGVYAGDSLKATGGYGGIKGMVYGWGRYVRGDKGWRSQFAYPKEFYLDEGQEHLVEHLRVYHVPVYVKQPMLIYSPEEDGYGYGQSEEDRDRGASEIYDAGQAGSSS